MTYTLTRFCAADHVAIGHNDSRQVACPLCRLIWFIQDQAHCPCCEEFETCAEECTFGTDCVSEHARMMEAREAIRSVRK